MLRKLFYTLVLLFFLGTLASAGGVYYLYLHFSRDLPDFATIEDYRPEAVTTVLANDGTLIAEFYNERRYPVRLEEVPEKVQYAFVSAEDANFFQHPGIDLISIVRALVKNIRSGTSSQGGSTITQQVVKNLLLTPEKKLERKIKEAILSYRLEKRLSKKEILEIYLNEIFFGNTAYGVKAAAKLYFHKELADLTLGEASLLGGLPKAPSRYSPLINPEKAYRRQKYVLKQMTESGFITEEEAETARNEAIKVYPATKQNIFHAPYYVTEVRQRLQEKWPNLRLDTGGYTIHTAVDLKATEKAERAVRAGLREVDKRRGWRGPLASYSEDALRTFDSTYSKQIPSILKPHEVYPALVTEIQSTGAGIKVKLGTVNGSIDLASLDWTKKRRDKNDEVIWQKPLQGIRIGDVIEVALASDDAQAQEKTSQEIIPLRLDQTPELEGALVLLDPESGRVVTLIGGYNYERSQFNRATQMSRQPGSSFKPVMYLSAVDGFGYTPSTLVNDQPRTFRVGTSFWTPGNFDNKFMGRIPLFRALELSRNLVSADLISRIGIDAPIRYAKKVGITSPLGKNLSLSLGSSEVKVLEIVRAYGVFAARGVLFDSVFITKIFDRDTTLLFDAEEKQFERASQAVSEQSAFIMAHMMEGVVQRGTATKLRALERPVAGKTGTTNDQMDAWFIGYTPKWVSGVWVGFDRKRMIGKQETGGKAAAPIFLTFMKEFLDSLDAKEYDKLFADEKSEADRLGLEYEPPEKLAPDDFTVPENVVPFLVDKNSGYRTTQDNPRAIVQYFLKGTEPPTPKETEEESTSSYLESADL